MDTLDRLLEGCGFGLELASRTGIGIDRTQIRDLLKLTMGERLALACANDEAYAATRRTLRWVADRSDGQVETDRGGESQARP